MTEDTDLLRGILDELREVKYWSKVAGLQTLRKVAQEYLRDDESKLVYELSDGQKSTREIVEELRKKGKTITHSTVANMWKRWVAVTLVEPSDRYQGRFRKVASLELLGIEAPEIQKKEYILNEQK